MKKISLTLLAVLLLSIFSSCSSTKEVENEPITLLMGEEEVTANYTGTLEANVPVNDGTLTFDDGSVFTGSFLEGLPAEGTLTYDGGAVFTGSFAKGLPAGGALTDYPVELQINGAAHTGLYTGESSGLQPEGKGQFTAESTEFTYDGGFADGQPDGDGTAENLEITVKLEETDYTGLYTGAVTDFQPTGTGTFSYTGEGDSHINYEGGFDGPAFSGEGTLDSNEYIVHFNDSTGKIDRKGLYVGAVLNGVASGTGEFTATNDNGETYKLTGNWENGLQNGQGGREWLDVGDSDPKDYLDEAGNYTEGIFDPSPLEAVRYLSQRMPKFTLSDVAADYIAGHEDLFLSHPTEDLGGYIDSTFSYNQFEKDAGSFQGKLLNQSGLQISQTSVYTTFPRFNVVRYIAYDRETYSNGYYVYMINDSSDIVTNDNVRLTALPLAYTTFDNTSGGQTWTAVCLGVNITKG